MKSFKFNILVMIGIIAFLLLGQGCSDDKEVEKPVIIPPPTEDSVFYTLKVDNFELLAASEEGTAAFLQTDETFAFRCLYDSCQTSRLVAYCDSAGVVERICIENKVFDMLYHQDNAKLDILYSDNGKMAWIKDVQNPYKKTPGRSESGDVPYSAVKVMTNLSHAIYTIINSYPLYFSEKIYAYIARYSAPPFESKMAIEYTANVLGKEYGKIVGNHYAEIASIMTDYSAWVVKELYGEAIPLVRQYAEWTGSHSVNLKCFVNEVDTAKADFKIGIIIQEEGKTLFSSQHNLGNKGTTYKPNAIDYTFAFNGLETGKKYKFKAYLAPLSSSKYLTGMKCLLDYYKYGQSKHFDLLEAKGEVKVRGTNNATIELSAALSDHQKIKMGMFYGLNPKLPENDRMEIECEIDYKDYVSSDRITKTVELKGLTSDTTYYYRPYIIYEGNIVNREFGNLTDVIEEKDRVFCGEIKSFQLDSSDLRDMLVRIYNECGGKNWEHQTNWCTDVPVTEWEGIIKIERGEGGDKFKDGTYIFEFMELNKLTGVVTFEGCNKMIQLVPSRNLEGLVIKDCPKLQIGDNIYSLYPNLRTLYADGMQLSDKSWRIGDKGIATATTFRFDEMQSIESIEIKNCGGAFLRIDISNCPKLKTVICQNNSFDKEHYSNPSAVGTTCVRIESCKELENVQCKDNECIWDVDIFSCHKLDNVNISNILQGNSSSHIVNCSINYLVYKPICNFHDNYGMLYLGSIGGDSNLSIRNIRVNNSSIYLNYEDVISVIKHLRTIYANECYFRGGGSNGQVVVECNFSNYDELETVELTGCSALKLNFNGCRNLKELTVKYTCGEIIDIRNCPKLRYADCSSNSFLTDILFDGNINSMYMRCDGNLKLLKMIPDFYNPTDNSSFFYDKRYEYVWDEDHHLIVIDHKCGWWYPGEPEAGHHGR